MSSHERYTTLAQVYEDSRRILGDKIIAPDTLDAKEFYELKQIMCEHPLLFSGFRFPTNPNTSKPMIDMDRILLNQGLLRATKMFTMSHGRIVSEFSGTGSDYKETISGRNNNGGVMSVTLAKSKRVKLPEPPRSKFIFSPLLSKRQTEYGMGKPIIMNELNRTEINEQLDELTDNSKKPMSNDEAWAMALDESLRDSIMSSSRELNRMGIMAEHAIGFIACLNTSPMPPHQRMAFNLALIGIPCGLDYLRMMMHRKKMLKTGEDIELGNAMMGSNREKMDPDDLPRAKEYYDDASHPREWRVSLFSPMFTHPDYHMAVLALMNYGNLVKYRK